MAGFDWGSLAGAVASLGSAYLSSRSASNAGKAQTQAAQQSNDMQWRIYQDQVARNQPFYNAGLAAQNRYMQLLGLASPSTTTTGQTASQPASGMTNGQYYLAAHPELQGTKWAKDEASLFQHFYKYGARDGAVWGPSGTQMQTTSTTTPDMTQQQAFDAFRNTPGYQFGLNQGRRAVESSAAARGGLNSGAALKALTKFGNDYADQQGFTPYMNRLSGLFGGAQTAAGQMGSYGANFANNYGQNLQNAAQARANSTYASNQAWNNGINSAASFFGDWYGSRNRAQTPTGAGAYQYGSMYGWGG
jgi:hypothetical protein